MFECYRMHRLQLGQIGEELVDFASLKQSGAFAFTDDGVGVQQASMMLAAMKQAAAVDKAIVAHCEDNSLINRGSVHEGKFSTEQGSTEFLLYVNPFKLLGMFF